jgi:hypothetical protein
MSTRDVYRALSLWNLAKAAYKGPKFLARTLVRRAGHRELAKAMRRAGL